MPVEAPVSFGVVDALRVNAPVAETVGGGVRLSKLLGDGRAVAVKNDVAVGVNGLENMPVSLKHSV